MALHLHDPSLSPFLFPVHQFNVPAGTGICSILGIKGNATVEHFLAVGEDRIVVRAKGDEFTIKRQSKGRFSFERVSALEGGEISVAHVHSGKNRLNVKDNPAIAMGNPTLLARLCTMSSSFVSLWRTDSPENPYARNARKMGNRVAAVADEIFGELNRNATAFCARHMQTNVPGDVPESPEMPPQRFYSNNPDYGMQVRGIYRLLKFKTGLEVVSPGYIDCERDGGNYLIDVVGQEFPKHAKESAKFIMSNSGVSQTTIKLRDMPEQTYRLDPTFPRIVAESGHPERSLWIPHPNIHGMAYEVVRRVSRLRNPAPV